MPLELFKKLNMIKNKIPLELFKKLKHLKIRMDQNRLVIKGLHLSYGCN